MTTRDPSAAIASLPLGARHQSDARVNVDMGGDDDGRSNSAHMDKKVDLRSYSQKEDDAMDQRSEQFATHARRASLIPVAITPRVAERAKNRSGLRSFGETYSLERDVLPPVETNWRPDVTPPAIHPVDYHDFERRHSYPRRARRTIRFGDHQPYDLDDNLQTSFRRRGSEKKVRFVDVNGDRIESQHTPDSSSVATRMNHRGPPRDDIDGYPSMAGRYRASGPERDYGAQHQHPERGASHWVTIQNSLSSPPRWPLRSLVSDSMSQTETFHAQSDEMTLPAPRRAVARAFAPPITPRSKDDAHERDQSRSFRSSYEMSPAVQTRRVKGGHGSGTGVNVNNVLLRSSEHDITPASESSDRYSYGDARHAPPPVVHNHIPDRLYLFSGDEVVVPVSVTKSHYRGIVPAVGDIPEPIRYAPAGKVIFGVDPSRPTETRSHFASTMTAEAAGWRVSDSNQPQISSPRRFEVTTSTLQEAYGRAEEGTRVGNRAVTTYPRQAHGQWLPERHLELMSDHKQTVIPRRRRSIVLTD